MPELPDITIYLEALERRIVGERLLQVRVASPFLLRPSSRRSRPSKERSCVDCGAWENASPSDSTMIYGSCCT